MTILNAISDHGNVIASKVITYFGVTAGVAGGSVLGVANDTLSRITEPSLWGLADYAAVVSIAAGVSLLIKNIVDVVYKIKSNGKV